MKWHLLIGAAYCACAVLAHGAAADKKKKIDEELSGVPRPELAARVSEIVRQTPAHERSAVAAVAVEVVAEKHPAAVNTVQAALQKDASKGKSEVRRDDDDKSSGKGNGNGNGNGNSGPGNGNGNSGGNGGVGHGPGPDKPGHQVSPRPINDTLPNGKPRHFPPDPPRRPVDPPRPIKYNTPRAH